MLTIYGVEYVNKVRFVANYLGLDYELKQVDLFNDEQRSEKFLELNPVGKVRVIQDGDFTLFESMAIFKYLADKHTSSLYPKVQLTNQISRSIFIPYFVSQKP